MTKLTVGEKYLEDTLALREQIEGAFIELGKRFYTIREEKLYLAKYESFEEFLLEAKMSYPNASKLIAVYQTLVLEYKIPEERLISAGSWSSLYAIIPYAKDRSTALELVDRAALLTRDDLKRSFEDESPSRRACSHDDTYTVKICKGCGGRVGVPKTI